MGKIEGTLTWVYVVVGTVPPGVTDEKTIAAEILRASSWSGGILSVIRSQRVVAVPLAPDEADVLVRSALSGSNLM